MARLEAALRQIQTKKARLQEAYLSGVLELPDFAAAKKELDQGEAQISGQLVDNGPDHLQVAELFRTDIS